MPPTCTTASQLQVQPPSPPSNTSRPPPAPPRSTTVYISTPPPPIPPTSVSLTALMQDALVIAKNGGVDVFNALDLMGSSEFLSDLKFGPGDGALQCVVCLLCFLARLPAVLSCSPRAPA